MTIFENFEKHANNIKYPVLVSLNYDADRVIVIVKDGKVTYLTFNGTEEYLITDVELNNDFLSMHKQLSAWKDYFKNGVVFEGELYSLKDGKIIDSQASNNIAAKLIRGTASKEEQSKIGITLWDCVTLKDYERGSNKTDYTIRFEWLRESMLEENYIRLRIAKEEVAWSEKELYDIGQKWIKDGEEGAIVKNPHADGFLTLKIRMDLINPYGYYERSGPRIALKLKKFKKNWS